MALFVVRVELARADSEEYVRLHEKMKAYGFKRTATYDDGLEYELPTGTYMGEKSDTPSNIRERVSALADPLSVGKAPILVCQVERWAAYLFKD